MLNRFINVLQIILALSACMKAEKVSMDTSGPQGFLLGGLSLGVLGSSGTSGSGSGPGTGGQSVSGNLAGYVNVTGSPLHIILTPAIGTPIDTPLTASGDFSITTDAMSGTTYTASLGGYTGGQNCILSGGQTGIIGTDSISIECERHLMIAASFMDDYYSSYELRLLSVNHSGLSTVSRYSTAGSVDPVPELVWNGSEYLLLWQVVSGGNTLIKAARFHIDGSQIGSAATVYSTSSTATIDRISADWNSTAQKYIVVWGEASGVQSSIKFFISGDLSAQSTATNLYPSAGTTTDHNRHPDVVWTGTSYLVTFVNDYYYQIYVFSISSAGIVNGTNTWAYNGPGTIDGTGPEYPAFVKGAANILLTFSDVQDDGSGINRANLRKAELTGAGSIISGTLSSLYTGENGTNNLDSSQTWAIPTGVYVNGGYLIAWDHVLNPYAATSEHNVHGLGFKNGTIGAMTGFNSEDFLDTAGGSSVACRGTTCFVSFGAEGNGSNPSLFIHDTDPQANLGGNTGIYTYGTSVSSIHTVLQ